LLNETAKNLITHHEKILIATEVFDDYNRINQQISTLIEQAYLNNYNEIIDSIKQLVPEYKRMN
jgi:hypothetical protein